MLPLLAPHPPPTQPTRKVLYAPTTNLSPIVCVCVCVCVSEPACACDQVIGERKSEGL